MIIKEIEELLDINRANIRFYEKEGLLKPQRNENGYRDYSEKDLDTLRKIKLLRQLHLPVDTIKQIQNGTQDLGDAMQTQIDQLSSDIANFIHAQNICQYIKNDQVNYENLDAQKYLSEIDVLIYKDTPYFSIQNDKISLVPYPWRRYFARTLDIGLYALIWLAFSHLILRWNPVENIFINLLEVYIYSALMLVLEPLLLSMWGTTLGKWLFGMFIRDINGKKLTYKQAFQRTFGVFSNGMGYCIPIYNLVREYKCWAICKDQEPMPWDEDVSYTIKDKKIIRVVAYIGMTVALFAVGLLIVFLAQMPIHRGNITAAQYYENCNDIASYTNLGFSKYLNKHGQWINHKSSNMYVVNVSNEDYPRHILTISNGAVSGVKIEAETDENDIITGYNKQIYMSVMSFIAAQKGMSFVHFYLSGILKKISHEYESFSFVESGIRVTNKIEYSGYDLYGEHMLFPINGQKQHFHLKFTLEKIR